MLVVLAPKLCLEPPGSRGFVQENVGKLDEADAVAVVSAEYLALAGHDDVRSVGEGGSVPEPGYCEVKYIVPTSLGTPDGLREVARHIANSLARAGDLAGSPRHAHGDTVLAELDH